MTTIDPVRSDVPAPGDRFAAARWMLDRHPVLLRLLSRVPGFVDPDGDPDVDLLAETVLEYEQYVAAWKVYEQRFPAPRDEERFDTWQRSGPQTTPLVSAIGAMSAPERARMRMLATFSAERVPISVLDFQSLDEEGRALLTDWTVAVRAA